MKKITSSVLIILGILLLLSPFIRNIIIRLHSRYTVEKAIKSHNIIANKNSELEAEFDFDSVKDVDFKSLVRGLKEFNDKFVIGTISIPSINIKLPIMRGLSEPNLMAGAATMRPDQVFGEGNFPLAGHRMKNKNILFGRLMDIDIGATVLISDGENIYEYKIYDTVVVPDTSMDMLYDDKSIERDGPIIALMTCFYSSKTGKRFFAMGELVDTYPNE